MPRVSIAAVRERLRIGGRNPRTVARVLLGALVAADLVAALIALKPWAGSAEDLERQAVTLSQEVRQKDGALQKLRGIVNKVESARTDGDHFMDGYLLSQRSVSSKLLDDLTEMARKANIREKGVNFAFEPVENSDTLTKTTITANYEGTYADLMHFLNQVDRSQRLLIIESLAATPQPQGTLLNITMKVNAFIREGGAVPADQAADEPAREEAMPAQRAVAPRPVQSQPPRAAPAPIRPVPVRLAHPGGVPVQPPAGVPLPPPPDAAQDTQPPAPPPGAVPSQVFTGLTSPAPASAIQRLMRGPGRIVPVPAAPKPESTPQ
jgi:Tfp pilus assembly protein PilO